MASAGAGASFGNPHARREVTQWLAREAGSAAQSNARGTRPPIGFGSLLFLIGNTGTGKTHMVKSICAEADYDLIVVHSHNCEGAKEMTDRIVKAARSRLVQALTGHYRPTVILIDELDTLIQMDRLALAALADLLQAGELPHVPIVAVCPPSCLRKLGPFKSRSATVHCHPLSEGDIFLLLKSRAESAVAVAGAGASPRCDELLRIAQAAAGNLHVAVRLLDERLAAPAPAPAPAPSPAAEPAAAPAEQRLLFGNTDGEADFRSVFQDPTPEKLADMIRVFSDDPWLHPLRFHENLIKEIRNRKGLAKEKRSIYGALLRALTDWDALMITGHTDLALETLAINIQTRLSRLPRRVRAAVSEDDLQDFTKIFSQISIYKKQERALYAKEPCDFPWADAQIFCRYSSSSA